MENYQQFPQLHNHPYAAANDQLGFIDFTDEPNIDPYIDLIRGGNNYGDIDETPIFNLSNHQSYDVYDHLRPDYGSVCAANAGQPFPAAAPPLEVYDFDVEMGQFAEVMGHGDFSMQKARVCEEPEMMDREESSGTTAAAPIPVTMNNIPTNKKGGGKVDRSRTLISERTRRGKMKEKLYALRSIVPNITKMDKASIVGDAVSYVQDLQTQAKTLKAEIAGLESSLVLGDRYEGLSSPNAKKMNASSFYSTPKKIFKMDVFEGAERSFYVRIVSNKGRGVATSLYKAIESFTSVAVQNSNLAASPENYLLTFTMHVMGQVMDVSLPNVKLWVASVFLNQGFDFETSQFS